MMTLSRLKLILSQMIKSELMSEKEDKFRKVTLAPLVVYDYLKKRNNYRILFVNYFGDYNHMYAVKIDTTNRYSEFIRYLKSSFKEENHKSYFEMKRE